MNKIIQVIDEKGNTYSSTYVKRAKGLIKKNRAFWVDEDTICLKKPQEKLEVNMNINDLDKMLALLQANNSAIRSTNRPNSYASAIILVDTYNEIVLSLKNFAFDLPKNLESIDTKKYIGQPTSEIQEMVQIVFNKGTLLYSLLKFEREKMNPFPKMEEKTENFDKNSFVKDIQDFANKAVNFGMNVSNEVMKNLDFDKLNEEIEEKLKNKNFRINPNDIVNNLNKDDEDFDVSIDDEEKDNLDEEVKENNLSNN